MGNREQRQGLLALTGSPRSLCPDIWDLQVRPAACPQPPCPSAPLPAWQCPLWVWALARELTLTPSERARLGRQGPGCPQRSRLCPQPAQKKPIASRGRGSSHPPSRSLAQLIVPHSSILCHPQLRPATLQAQPPIPSSCQPARLPLGAAACLVHGHLAKYQPDASCLILSCPAPYPPQPQWLRPRCTAAPNRLHAHVQLRVLRTAAFLPSQLSLSQCMLGEWGQLRSQMGGTCTQSGTSSTCWAESLGLLSALRAGRGNGQAESPVPA